MTHPRQEFLATLFQLLEEQAVPYCVSRNYQAIYEDTSSDVDLVAQPDQVVHLEHCLRAAALASNHRVVLHTHYINSSYVYWHPDGGFLRVDVETEVRWRVFPVLSAKAVVTLRRPQGAFYIPHPRHESVILITAALWRAHLSERYRQQLARLYSQVANPEELQRTFRACFGKVGPELLDCLATSPGQIPGPRLWSNAKRSLLLNTFRDAPNRRAGLRYLVTDLKRFTARLWQPPGLSILYASNGRPGPNLDNFFQRTKLLYPLEKSELYDSQISPHTPVSRVGLGLRLQARRLYALFKGGMFICSRQLSDEGAFKKIIRTHSRYLYPSRSFVWIEPAQGQTLLAHVQTGFMAELNPNGGARDPSDGIIEFISRILERRTRRRPKQKGAFVVILGLDGSGKTTVARTLCLLALEQNRFDQVRYSHWQLPLTRDPEFPSPDHRNLPRKPMRTHSLVRSLFSASRLGKNLLRANLAYWLRVRALLRRNSLVLVDRYFYNYFLDPVSVKYYGPAWLAESLRPLFPRPDLVVVLEAPADVLLARKQELSREQVIRQIDLLRRLRLDAAHTLRLDARRPAPENARAIWKKLVELFP